MTIAIFVSTSYETISNGKLLLPRNEIKTDTLASECEVFIPYVARTPEDSGAVYALKNITMRRDSDFIEVTFDPNTDVTAIAAHHVHDHQHKPNHAFCLIAGSSDDAMPDVPRFNISSHANANDEQLIALDHELRGACRQFADGLITLTDFVFALAAKGITVTNIHQNINDKSQPIAEISRRPTHVIDCCKDNGVVDNNDYPVLARLSIVL